MKLSLNKKLEAVECDYEMQLQALQKDIMSLRKDLNNQKKNQVVLINEKNREMMEMMRHNEQLLSSLDIVKKENSSMNNKLLEFEEKVNSERISMHEHVCQLELLKSEVGATGLVESALIGGRLCSDFVVARREEAIGGTHPRGDAGEEHSDRPIGRGPTTDRAS